jgi:hypothetical protein
MAKLAYHLAQKSVKSFNACKMDKRKQLKYAPVKETDVD